MLASLPTVQRPLLAAATRAGPIVASLTPTSLLAAVKPATCAAIDNCFDLAPGAFDNGADAIGSSSGIAGDLLFLAVFFFFAGKIWSEMDGSAEGSDADAPTPAHPSAISKPGKSDKRAQKQVFGWIHADLRVPLPKYEDLQTGCHLIGQGVGDHEGYPMYLCASKQPTLDGLSQCELSTDFTKHYGANVYLCRGSA